VNKINISIKTNKQYEDECLRYKDALYNLSRYLTSDENEADDLFQETLLRSYQFFHTFKSQTNCKAWLFKIMRNLFINHCRKKKRQLDFISFENQYDSEAERSYSSDKWHSISPENFVINGMLSPEITYALSMLPEDYRMVVILADIELMSYNDMAKILNCPIGTVRSRLSRGRNSLKKLLFKFALKEGIIKTNPQKMLTQ
jgi:RNA polymerase sigma-70 factor (ECF subfamily)